MSQGDGKGQREGPTFAERKKGEPGNSELICLTLINGKIGQCIIK